MRTRAERVALGMVIVAVIPYIALKVLWLAGSTIGLVDAAVLTEMHSTRMVVGNNVTIMLELLAVALALALTSSWGQRVPGWIMLVVGAGASGLLAPIILGLPIGSILQLIVQGNVRTGGMDDMNPWVFATVYGGFGILAIGLAFLAWRYAMRRWGDLLDAVPPPPPAWAILVGAVGLLPFGVAMVWWGLAGPGDNGPQAMDAVVQRTTLIMTGLLAVGGFVMPLWSEAAKKAPRLASVVTWAGCTTAVLQAPTQVLLANGGNPTRLLIVIGLLTIPGASVYGLVVLRQYLNFGPNPRQSITGSTLSGRL